MGWMQSGWLERGVQSCEQETGVNLIAVYQVAQKGDGDSCKGRSQSRA